MIDTVRNWVSRLGRKSRTFRAFISRGGFTPTFTKNNYRDYAKEAYKKNPFVKAAISQTAESCAGIPPALYRISDTGSVAASIEGYERKGHVDRIERAKMQRAARGVMQKTAMQIKHKFGVPKTLARRYAVKAMVDAGELERVTSHELLAVLDQPNPYYQPSYQDFISSIVSYLEIGGSVLIEPVDNGQTLRHLKAIQPENLDFENETVDNPIGTIRIEINGAAIRWSYDPDPSETEIFYLRYFDPLNPLVGMSPIESASRSIDVNNMARTWNMSTLQNGAQYSGIIHVDGRLTAEQRNAYKRQFRQDNQDVGGILLQEGGGGVKFEPVSMSAADMQWADLNNATAREISIVFNVAPEILGDSANKTYCLPGSAKVATPTGQSDIKDIRPGDTVYSYDTEEQRIVPRAVTWQGQVGTKQTYRVKARGVDLEATGNHPVLVLDAVKDGPHANSPRMPVYRYRRVDKLQVGDVIVKAHTYPDGSSADEKDWPTVREMEFSGAMSGDGFAAHYETNSVVWVAGVNGGPRNFYRDTFHVANDDLANVKRHMRSGHHGGVQYTSVTEITPVDVKPVYDIEVEGLHNFFAENVCVHNSNFESARRAFYLEKVIPLMDKIYGFLNSTVVQRFDQNLFLDYETDGIDELQTDMNKVFDRILGALDRGAITINEARASIGWDVKDGGDVLLVPANKIPLDVATAGEDETEQLSHMGDGHVDGPAALDIS